MDTRLTVLLGLLALIPILVYATSSGEGVFVYLSGLNVILVVVSLYYLFGAEQINGGKEKTT